MKRKLLKNKRTWGLLALALLAAAAVLWAVTGQSGWQSRNYPLAYTDEVMRWAEEYGVDPYLVYAVILTESGFQPQAESSAGARGLMQMTRDTFDWVKGQIAPAEELAFDDLYRPDAAVRFGVYYLSRCLQRYRQDVSTAAAAYHSGWGTVDGLLSDAAYTEDGLVLREFPYRQMRHYVSKVNEAHQKYTALYA